MSLAVIGLGLAAALELGLEVGLVAKAEGYTIGRSLVSKCFKQTEKEWRGKLVGANLLGDKIGEFV